MKDEELDGTEYRISPAIVNELPWDELPQVQQAILLVLYEAYFEDPYEFMEDFQIREQAYERGYMKMDKEELQAVRKKLIAKYNN